MLYQTYTKKIQWNKILDRTDLLSQLIGKICLSILFQCTTPLFKF